MQNLINTALNAVWPQICAPRELRTPDASAGRIFTLVKFDQTSVDITTEGGSSLRIQREAFFEALRYLTENQHGESFPCEIRFDQRGEKAGSLCHATSAVNSGTLVITYIVPMLETNGFDAFSSCRPNAVWLV